MPAVKVAPSYLAAYVVAIGSLLSGAAVVHQIYKPDLVRCVVDKFHARS